MNDCNNNFAKEKRDHKNLKTVQYKTRLHELFTNLFLRMIFFDQDNLNANDLILSSCFNCPPVNPLSVMSFFL